ncbi:MAG TPA: hypothetical protein VNQ53_08190 [Nocardioides sp.]|nr:hypothetical protein [Nocardioides sp.]
MEHRKLRPATILFDVEVEGPILVLRGGLVGADLNKFAGALALVQANHSSRFVVDVSEVDGWSLVAQAMLLMTSRRKSDRGELLVLRGANEALREQSHQLGVFERIGSIDSHPTRPTRGAGGVTGGTEARAARPAGGARYA